MLASNDQSGSNSEEAHARRPHTVIQDHLASDVQSGSSSGKPRPYSQRIKEVTHKQQGTQRLEPARRSERLRSKYRWRWLPQTQLKRTGKSNPDHGPSARITKNGKTNTFNKYIKKKQVPMWVRYKIGKINGEWQSQKNYIEMIPLVFPAILVMVMLFRE